MPMGAVVVSNSTCMRRSSNDPYSKGGRRILAARSVRLQDGPARIFELVDAENRSDRGVRFRDYLAGRKEIVRRRKIILALNLSAYYIETVPGQRRPALKPKRVIL